MNVMNVLNAFNVVNASNVPGVHTTGIGVHRNSPISELID